ncbi:hypothetical protein BKY29_00165 [Weissella confusa]|nr:hypothetical protein BKY29_00165 [Weissella confusa]
MSSLYTSDNLTNWTLPVKCTMTWYPTGGPNGGPYIEGSLTPASTSNSNKSFSYSTKTAGLTLTNPGRLSVAVNAANGSTTQNSWASIDTVSGSLAAGKINVKYVDDATGAEIKTATSMIGNVQDVVGITNISSGAKAGTDDYTFAAPVIKGYTVASANDATVLGSTTNTLTIRYKALVCQESVVTAQTSGVAGSSVIASYWNADQTNPLGSGSAVANSIMDASLVRAGFSYVVLDQNGSSYATMSAAAAAASMNTWDSTSNSAAVQSDATPQTWTVSYTPDYQAAYPQTRD